MLEHGEHLLNDNSGCGSYYQLSENTLGAEKLVRSPEKGRWHRHS